MSSKFPEHKKLDLPGVNWEILEKWKKNDTFRKSIEIREGRKDFVFYEGPPSANGMPGIHHVMARTIKDIFCRYKTQKGFRVERKAGWDTHGLPVELSVEKNLGITKDDIGKTISIADYNKQCRTEVMQYTGAWEELTEKIGFWVDMDHPYITYDNRYIETLWWLLRQMFDKGLLYKGYTIQPYSPAAGTGLSSHELNQPGCYRDVKDTTVTALFKVTEGGKTPSPLPAGGTQGGTLPAGTHRDTFFLAWTTTPWTLPSNTALCVGPNISYVMVKTYNPYSGDLINVILAKDLVSSYFDPEMLVVETDSNLSLPAYDHSQKHHPYRIIAEYTGAELEGIRYEQLINWVQPRGDAFRVVTGDFVTTEDGTGIVHIAPTFGSDDDRVARINGIAPLILVDKEEKIQAMVDRKGRFFPLDQLQDEFVNKYVNKDSYGEFAGRYVKNEYDPAATEDQETIDVEIAVQLKMQGKAFKIEKYVHNYPHCWRTDKPVLYYPMDSWFIKTTAYKEQLIEKNKTINWKPESTGTGRFGNWLENLVDWNLSRSRFWGTPLPIWLTEDGKELKCIGSVAELKAEIEKAVSAGFMSSNPLKDFEAGNNSDENYSLFDLHRPWVDEIYLVSDGGQKMTREPDLIDVWFDSGAMPFAQLHYPFEHKDDLGKFFPADFIAEGVDQTRGWFFTLHAISVMLFDSVSFKNLVSNGLVLDKDGNKMSKRLGNSVDPYKTINEHGSDPLRWYTVTNAPPWDNLKFDISGVDEVKRKFFGTLFNTYSFFSLYANIDGFTYEEPDIPMEERPELDRWILSLLNSLVRDVDGYMDDYFPTKSARAIQDFVLENLSNWFVRLSRRRFWGGEYDSNKISAYQTLYTCLETVSKLSAPFVPFYMDRLFLDLNEATGKDQASSVHLTDFPGWDESAIDLDLEERMQLAQSISSMVLGLRRKVNIKVRQPLARIMIPVLNDKSSRQIEAVAEIIRSEINVKDIELLEDDKAGILVKKIRPNFKLLGSKHGKNMKAVSTAIGKLSQEDIAVIEREGTITLILSPDPSLNLVSCILNLEEVEILSQDIPGWLVANDGSLTVALDITITEELKQEGIAREFINRIQNLRKDSGFEVTDKIEIRIKKHDALNEALNNYKEHIGTQTLAVSVQLVDDLDPSDSREVDLEEGVKTLMQVRKIVT